MMLLLLGFFAGGCIGLLTMLVKVSIQRVEEREQLKERIDAMQKLIRLLDDDAA